VTTLVLSIDGRVDLDLPEVRSIGVSIPIDEANELRCIRPAAFDTHFEFDALTRTDGEPVGISENSLSARATFWAFHGRLDDG
jgi:hypothetical protein